MRKIKNTLEYQLLDYMQEFKVYTKEELVFQFGENERTIRRALTKLKEYHPIISLSSERGYMILGDYNNLTDDELDQIINKAERQVNEYESRKEHFNKAERSLIAYIKSAQANRNKA